MIELKKVQTRSMISSVDLYDAMEKNRKKYYLWITRKILLNNSLQVPRDFFVSYRSDIGKPGRPMTDVYISITLAKSLCIQEGTVVSKKIRYYIEDHLEPKGRLFQSSTEKY